MNSEIRKTLLVAFVVVVLVAAIVLTANLRDWAPDMMWRLRIWWYGIEDGTTNRAFVSDVVELPTEARSRAFPRSGNRPGL